MYFSASKFYTNVLWKGSRRVLALSVFRLIEAGPDFLMFSKKISDLKLRRGKVLSLILVLFGF